jgi:predicted DNA-binding transcriptional regulator AlpA
MIQPRVIRLKDIPEYLGINLNYFNKHIRPHIPEIRYGPQMVGFDRLDLDRWVDETKGRCSERPETVGEASWDANDHQDCIREGVLGTSTKLSEKHAFTRALAQATSKKLN